MAIVARSASTIEADPYRAGVELGESLRPIAPEVVFLFATVHYETPQELLDGLYDSLENPDLVIIGNSGDGFLETSRVADIGVAALGINSGGAVRWLLASAEGVGEAPEAATQQCLDTLQEMLGGRDPALYFLVSDFRTDATRIEAVIRDRIQVPVVGGLAADDNQMKRCRLFANRQVLSNAVVLLAVEGPLAFEIAIGNTLRPIGNAGRIDAAEGAYVSTIDGIPAMDFIERETGKPVLQSDRGIVTLTIHEPGDDAVKRLRAIVPDFSGTTGGIGLYGGIEEGKTVRVCLARPEDLVAEVYRIAEASRQLAFQPAAGLIVSCAGRKWLLAGNIQHEVKALADTFSGQLAVAGFPSFGEIGPLRTSEGYSPNLFHNMTYVLLLIGDRSS